jgi:hypothetical protein
MVGDRATGIFHEVGAGNATSNRQAIRLPHLRIGQKFDHDATLAR